MIEFKNSDFAYLQRSNILIPDESQDSSMYTYRRYTVAYDTFVIPVCSSGLSREIHTKRIMAAFPALRSALVSRLSGCRKDIPLGKGDIDIQSNYYPKMEWHTFRFVAIPVKESQNDANQYEYIQAGFRLIHEKFVKNNTFCGCKLLIPVDCFCEGVDPDVVKKIIIDELGDLKNNPDIHILIVLPSEKKSNK